MPNITNHQGISIQTQTEISPYTSHLSERLFSERQQMSAMTWEKKWKPHALGRNVNWCSHYGKSMGIPQKTKVAYDLILIMGIYLKKTKILIQKDICNPIFIEALFTIPQIKKQPKCPSISKRIKKMWDIHPMKYYSAAK